MHPRTTVRGDRQDGLTREETSDRSSREIEPGRRGLWLGVIVYRAVSFAIMLALTTVASLEHPEQTWLLLSGIGGWIVAVSWLRAWDRAWVCWVDLAISTALLFAAPILVAPGALDDRPFFAAPYPLSTILTWAAARGLRGGLLSAVVLSVPLALGRPLNGLSYQGLSAGRSVSLAMGVIYYLIGGIVIGLFSRTVDRAADELRRANEATALERDRAVRLSERETLARAIHDSILQTLALVHRRGRDLASMDQVDGARVGELVSLLDAEERELRTLLRREPEEPPFGSVPLRTVLEGGALGVSGVPVTVSTVEPAWVAADQAAEISAAVRAALDNVVRHASASKVTVFGERDGPQVVISIRDDGVGFVVDGVRSGGGFGIERSIRGRIEDIGGRVRIRSELGGGTEVELRVAASSEGELPA